MKSTENRTIALLYTQTDQTPTVRGPVICLLILLVFTLHGMLQFILYYGRFHRWPLCDSDLIVFGLPNALSLPAYAMLMVRWVMPKKIHAALKIIWMVIFSLILQFLSWWGSILIPINIYGS